jgi:hypothetical protein
MAIAPCPLSVDDRALIQRRTRPSVVITVLGIDGPFKPGYVGEGKWEPRRYHVHFETPDGHRDTLVLRRSASVRWDPEVRVLHVDDHD